MEDAPFQTMQLKTVFARSAWEERTLLLYMPDTEYQNHPEQLELLMPWSEAVQAECGKVNI